jgi:hypothetical protein
MREGRTRQRKELIETPAKNPSDTDKQEDDSYYPFPHWIEKYHWVVSDTTSPAAESIEEEIRQAHDLGAWIEKYPPTLKVKRDRHSAVP